MNRFARWLTLLWLLSAGATSFAQMADRQKQNFLRSQSLMDRYIAEATTLGISDERTLVEIYARDLEPTSQNVAAVVRLLATKRPRQDVVMLVRILGRLYTRDNRSGQNSAILRSLKTFIYSGDAQIAESALISYSRLPYQGDLLSLLRYGVANKIISQDVFSRELALSLVPDAPPDAQLAAARQLQQLNTDRGAEILATVFNTPEIVLKLAPKARAVVLGTLKKRDPVLPMALGQFGFFTGARYASWLHSVALLTEATGGEEYGVTVLRYLDDSNTDPRKILGYLSSNVGVQLMRKTGHRTPFTAAVARAFAFAEQFPDHPGMTPMVHEISQTLADLPE